MPGGTLPPFAGPRGCPPPGRRSINSWSLWGHRGILLRHQLGNAGLDPFGERAPPPTARPKNQPRGKTPWRHCRALCPSVRLTVEGCRSKVSASSCPSKGPGTEVLPRKKSSWAATKAVRHRVRVSCRRRTHCKDPPGLLNLLAEVVRRLAAGVLPGHLQVGRAEVELGQVPLVHKDLQGPVDLRHPGIGAEVLGLPLTAHAPTGLGSSARMAWAAASHLLSGHPQPPGQGPVLFPCQQIQPPSHRWPGPPDGLPGRRFSWRARLSPGAPSPHPLPGPGTAGRQPPPPAGPPAPRPGSGPPDPRIQPAVVVQQVHQVPAHRQQGLVQPPAGPTAPPGKTPRTPVPGPAGQVPPPPVRRRQSSPRPTRAPGWQRRPKRSPGPWRLLHHRVLQGQVLEVLLQFQGGHLQNSHGLEQCRGKLQHLRQFQPPLLVFHALSPFPIGFSLMIA